MKQFILNNLILLLTITSFASADDKRPNIVVIMTDDLGFSDLGCYGSEIKTPHLDALARGGLRFSQFYNTAKCHSSRVSLLTGQYCLAAGNTNMNHAVTSAEILGHGGYFTAMTGKWHLQRQPTDFGFQRYFGHLSGACNFFKGDKTFRLNGEKWDVPDSDFYTTVADVDFALRFLKDARKSAKPWYLYVAFNAPHAPLHALPEDYAKYKGRYADGWDVVRAARVAKQKKIGLLRTDLKASPRPEHVPAWESMKPWRQKYEANRMTTLAAMIDCVDQQVGRLIADLKANDEFDNTMILFVSDNGACPYDRRKPLLDVEPTNGDIALADSTGWSWARNTPFRYYKQNQFEGGIATPAIVHWPAGLKTNPGSVVDEPAHLIDVVPTLAEITKCEIPGSWPERELRPVSGMSLKPIFDGRSLGKRPPIHFLFSSDRALRDGDWKAVSFRQEAWELYNVAADRTELNNLAEEEPQRLQKMIDTWTQMTKNVLHASQKNYAPATEAKLPHRHPQWTTFDDSPAPAASKQTRPSKTQKHAHGIRARKNTKLRIIDGELRLEFSGDDPGIAMDMRSHKLPAGPYRLTFRLKGGTKGGGELFYTTDPTTTLPKGKRIEFEVHADEKYHDMAIEFPVQQRIYQLRVDVGDGVAKAVIADLKLIDSRGRPVMSWPKTNN